MSPSVTMKMLLESGVHFGHRTNKWNPLMRPYIFTERNGIHIIDLQQTVKLLEDAYEIVRKCVAEGGVILFVGTKRQAQEAVQKEAERCDMPYVNERWLGGTLTNWSTIQERIRELERLEKIFDTGEVNLLTKKEGLMISRDINRLKSRLQGVREMKKLPDLLFVVDIEREATAVHESNLREIPVIAMVDTNCDPRYIDYLIPSNDDAIRAINLLVGRMADAVIQGKMERKDIEEEAVPEAPSLIRHKIDEDEELDDEDLLGKSTLAKLAPHKSVEVEEEVEDEEVEETVVAAEEVAEEVVADVVAAEEVAEDDADAEEVVADVVETEAVAEETSDDEEK